MICQSRHHRRSTRLPLALLVLLAKCAHGPAEVVTINGEIRVRFMNFPILREAICAANFSRIPIAIRSVVSLDKSRVYLSARFRLLQSRLHARLIAENHSLLDLNNTPIFAGLMHNRVVQIRRRYLVGGLGPPALSRPRRRHLFTIRLKNGRFVRPILIACDQTRRCPSCSPLHVLNYLFRILRGPLARNDAQDQTVFAIERHEIPIVSLLRVIGVIRVAILLLFSNKSPFLIKLDFLRLRGKKRLIRRGAPLRDLRRAYRSASLCSDLRPSNVLFFARRSLRQYAPRSISVFPVGGEIETTTFPCVRKNAPCTFGNRADGFDFCRNARKRSSFRHFSCRSLGTRGSGSKTAKDRPWDSLLKGNGNNSVGNRSNMVKSMTSYGIAFN